MVQEPSVPLLLKALFIAVGGFLAAEVLARLYIFRLYKTKTGKDTSFLFYPEEWLIRITKICRYQPHPYIIYTKRPNVNGVASSGAFAANNFGFEGTRDVSQKKPAGTFRIICLGASNTEENHDPQPNNTYPDFLERELNKHFDGKIEVLNAGNSGYTSVESLNNFALRLLDFEPDMIVYYEAINDVYFSALLEGFRPDYAHARKNTPDQLGFWDRLPPVSWSFCYSWIRTKLLRIFAMTKGLIQWVNFYPLRPASHFEPQAISVYKRNVKSLSAIALAHGVKPVLVPFSYNPALKKGMSSRVLKTYGLESCQAWFVPYLDGNNAVLPEIAHELQGVEYLNVPHLEERFFMPQDDCHCTTQGLQELAERIAVKLLPIINEARRCKN
jgi:lysophospholipase L1-like esterase